MKGVYTCCTIPVLLCYIEGASGKSCQDLPFQLTVEFVKFLSLPDKKDEDEAEKVIAEMAANVSMCQIENDSDGNCLFEAISQLLYETVCRHSQIRTRIVDYIANQRSSFEDAVVAMRSVTINEEDISIDSERIHNSANIFENYIEDMRGDRFWRDTICIEAACIVSKIRITLLVSPAAYKVDFNGDDEKTTKHIDLAHIDNRHFRALVPFRSENISTPSTSFPLAPLDTSLLLKIVDCNLAMEEQYRCFGRLGIH